MGFTSKYFYVQGLQRAAWYCTFQPLDVDTELRKMELWLDANPKRRKRNYDRFIINWLNRAHRELTAQRHEGLRNSEVGKYRPERKPADYSAECAEILKRYPELA